MASHIRKRQYQPSSQPSITSYFYRTSTSQSQPSSRPAHSPLSPPVPDNVQSLLINVGMRVRKSVPEGYKTHKTLPSPPASQPSISNNTTTSLTRVLQPPPGSAPATFFRARELAPFCGLHEVGGYAVQSSLDTSSGMPALTYSQNSAVSSAESVGGSTVTAGLGTKKRGYDEEIEDELDAFFDEQEEVEHVLPAARVVRPLARLRGKWKVGGSTEMRVGGVDGDFDDGDVEFLAPMDVDA